jgi:hypothetical protein
MAFNFPAAPALNDLYPATPVAGQPQYIWNGYAWSFVPVGGTLPTDPPFEAMRDNNLIINGAFDVSQEQGFNANITASGAYFCDRWHYDCSGTGVVGLSAYNAPNYLPGFQNLMIGIVSTAQAAMAVNDFFYVYQNIEGHRIARLAWGTVNAQPITIGFWSVHGVPGLYGGAVRAKGQTRSYVFTYNHVAADVPQWNIVTISGDQAGTWAADNTVGLGLSFTIACGSTYTAPSINTWLAGNYIAAPGHVNAVAAIKNFRIGGVVMLAGTEMVPAARAPLIMRPYDTELMLCQRQFQKIGGDVANDAMIISNYSMASGTCHVMLPYPQPMRAPPAVSLVGGWTATNVTNGMSGVTFAPGTRSMLWMSTAIAAGLAYFNNAVGAYIKLDSRL